MRLRVEFTTEPFDLDRLPDHAVAAREAVRGAELDAVDVGPFGNTVEGSAEAVLDAVDRLLRASLTAGATRVSFQVNVVREAGEPGGSDGPGGWDGPAGPAGAGSGGAGRDGEGAA